MVEPIQTRTSSADGSSFRDCDRRVFSLEGRIVSALTTRGLAEWEALYGSGLYRTFSTSGDIVPTWVEDDETLAVIQRADPGGEWVAALGHERVPFVSYPYEWSFSMLRDAALLQLRLTSAALAEGMTLKDATPYNVQWRGSRPVFIDIGSFERARPGEPWAGYRQFCMVYLYPLLLESLRGVAFQPWLRGSIDGIPPAEFRKLLSRRDVLRRGVLRHVVRHAALERRHGGRGGEVRQELAEAGFDRRVVEATVAQLTRIVERLRPPVARDSAWFEYQGTCSYSDDDTHAKEQFVRQALGAERRSHVWDLGCNDGRYSRIAAEHADLTVALDSDRAVIDELYRALREEQSSSIIPLVFDVADPSPAIGWRNRERLTLGERGRPAVVLCLALVHHLSIGRNIPLRELVHWLRDLGSELVVEFPHRDDSMVRRLLGAKRSDAHPDYEVDIFDALLRERFDVLDRSGLPSATRTLYHARPR